MTNLHKNNTRYKKKDPTYFISVEYLPKLDQLNELLAEHDDLFLQAVISVKDIANNDHYFLIFKGFEFGKSESSYGQIHINKCEESDLYNKTF